MLRRLLLVLTVLILAGVLIGCGQQTRRKTDVSVVQTDFRLMGRDVINILGLNRNACYERYESPSYIDGH